MADSLRKGMFTLWWTDKGTGRLRVSFAADRDVLDRRYTRVWHADIRAELYSPDNVRLQPKLIEDEKTAPKKAKKKVAKKRNTAQVMPAGMI